MLETVEGSLHSHAGHQLSDKEFRYITTVSVTASIHWGLFSLHLQIQLT